MKKILLLLFLVLFLAGGFLGYMYFMEGKTPDIVFAELMGEEIPEDGEEEVVEDIPELVLQYVNVPPIQVTVARKGRVERIFSVQVILETEESEAIEEEIERNMPLLMNAFFTYLHKVGALPEFADISDLPFVRKRLKEQANEILGGDTVTDVLLQASFDRRLPK